MIGTQIPYIDGDSPLDCLPHIIVLQTRRPRRMKKTPFEILVEVTLLSSRKPLFYVPSRFELGIRSDLFRTLDSLNGKVMPVGHDNGDEDDKETNGRYSTVARERHTVHTEDTKPRT
mmetsp:Transcript_4048/g.7181  ORF Transcript_4048/g.7181 Transcript_4048/m.7181 type:complete len:117 (+) Transcript_4048:118-468(+)